MAHSRTDWELLPEWEQLLEEYSDLLAAQLPPVWELDAPHRFADDFFSQLCQAGRDGPAAGQTMKNHSLGCGMEG